MSTGIPAGTPGATPSQICTARRAGEHSTRPGATAVDRRWRAAAARARARRGASGRRRPGRAGSSELDFACRSSQRRLTVLLPRRGGLVQLDEVAGGVVEERLAVATHGHRIAHVDAPAPQLVDHRVEVVDEQREVLTTGRGRRREDQVDLLGAGIEPGTGEAGGGGAG